MNDRHLRELCAQILARAPRLSNIRIPAVTYRIQLNGDFTLEQAAGIVSYLHKLGVTDLYTSPIFRASEGSSHGYDVINQNEIGPKIGGEEGLSLLAETLKEHEMGLILDFVPNHMGIGVGNVLWQDLLENGPSSFAARYFDIDWAPRKSELLNKVLLPVLGDQYGAVLEASELVLQFSEGSFLLCYYDLSFPINPRQYPTILRLGLDELTKELSEKDLHLEELLSICTACDNLPPRTETDPAKVAERRREKEVIKRRLDALASASPRIRQHIEQSVRRLNGKQGDPRSFDLLDRLLDLQTYRLAHWRVAGEEINYRRFFDINDLAAIRMEDPLVFYEAHKLIFKLLEDGTVTGLRIDHPDGLFDPKEYFQRLQEEFFLGVCRIAHGELGIDGVPFDSLVPYLRDAFLSRLSSGLPLYVVAEKILCKGERIPESWTIFGTTGYEFLGAINGLFVNRDNERQIDEIYARFIGKKLATTDLIYEKKKLIMSASMASEINMLAYELNRISEMNRRSRDFTLNSLRTALIEYIACFPVYRTYADGFGVDDRDRRYIEQAIARAKRRASIFNVSIFDFLRDILLLRHGETFSNEERSLQLRFVMRLQQVTGPVMAKGLEDTAFYIYNRLVSLNEVGGDLERFGISTAEFHSQNIERLSTSRASLLATSTHDTKRSEDLRARIDAISELPDEWKGLLVRLSKIARPYRILLGEDRIAPDRNEEFLLYQTIVGAWPFGEFDREPFILRIESYMLKAAKEAKVNTSWVNPDVAWDEALISFVRAILRDERFIAELLPFQKRVAEIGNHNSLSQLLLKIVSPGVPDVYQGCEFWNFSLVDPDNRRPVDFAGASRALDEIERRFGGDRKDLARELWREREDGRVKLYVTWRALNFRRSQADLFLSGEYVPLESVGPRKENVIALSRRRGFRQAVAVVPRLVAKLLASQGQNQWAGSYLLLPSGSGGIGWTDLFTGVTLKPVLHRGQPALPLDALFRELPLALIYPSEPFPSRPEIS